MNSNLLTEISRPKILDDIIGQEYAIDKMKSYLTKPDETPHLILSGPPGCGKTSAIRAWAKHLYGEKASSSGGSNSRPVRFLNMSAMRNVKDVIERIHETCRYMHDCSGLRSKRGLVICDEADALTAESQEIMVYCIRKYEERWLFVLIMNQPSKIGKRLWETCEHIPFNSLTDVKSIVTKTIATSPFKRILKKDDIRLLMNAYKGDLRRILNASQGVKYKTKTFVPEWTLWDDDTIRNKTPSGIYNKLKDECDGTRTSEEDKLKLQLALSIHKPGSIRPILYAMEYI